MGRKHSDILVVNFDFYNLKLSLRRITKQHPCKSLILSDLTHNTARISREIFFFLISKIYNIGEYINQKIYKIGEYIH